MSFANHRYADRFMELCENERMEHRENEENEGGAGGGGASKKPGYVLTCLKFATCSVMVLGGDERYSPALRLITPSRR
jgi:hypothetical protein